MVLGVACVCTAPSWAASSALVVMLPEPVLVADLAAQTPAPAAAQPLGGQVEGPGVQPPGMLATTDGLATSADVASDLAVPKAGLPVLAMLIGAALVAVGWRRARR